MKEWKVLVILEYEWRVFRSYCKLLNWLVKQGMKLSSPILCFLNQRIDKHSLLVSAWKSDYEKLTGKIIVFYKCDDY